GQFLVWVTKGQVDDHGRSRLSQTVPSPNRSGSRGDGIVVTILQTANRPPGGNRGGSGSTLKPRVVKQPRRTCLHELAVLGAGASLASVPLRAAETPPVKISLAEWSLNKALFGNKLDHLDFPKTARRDYGIGAIELVNQFFRCGNRLPAHAQDRRRCRLSRAFRN